MRLRRPTGRQTAFGGAIAGMAALAATATAATRNRYITGSSQVVAVHEAHDGGIVVVTTDQVFWAPGNQAELVKSYAGSAARRMPYRINRFQRRRSDGLLAGTVDSRH